MHAAHPECSLVAAVVLSARGRARAAPRRRRARSPARPASAAGVRPAGVAGHRRAGRACPAGVRAERRRADAGRAGHRAPLGTALDASSLSPTRTRACPSRSRPRFICCSTRRASTWRRASPTTRGSTERARWSASPTRGSTSRIRTSSTTPATRASRGCSTCRLPPLGKHPDLEQQYGTTDGNGNVVAGAVWAAADIDALLDVDADLAQLPQDEVGHGTLVASCAAGNGQQGRSAYRGVAPKATLVVARVDGGGQRGDRQRRAVARRRVPLRPRRLPCSSPIVVNLSIGTDFGPHDGTMAWEQALASHVGPSTPGHALVVAAGNSGSIADDPVHQNVHVDVGDDAARAALGADGVAERRRADLGRDARRREPERRARRARTARGSRRSGRTTRRARTRATTGGRLQRQRSRAAARCRPARTARSSCGRARGPAGPTT